MTSWRDFFFKCNRFVSTCLDGLYVFITLFICTLALKIAIRDVINLLNATKIF